MWRRSPKWRSTQTNDHLEIGTVDGQRQIRLLTRSPSLRSPSRSLCSRSPSLCTPSRRPFAITLLAVAVIVALLQLPLPGASAFQLVTSKARTAPADERRRHHRQPAAVAAAALQPWPRRSPPSSSCSGSSLQSTASTAVVGGDDSADEEKKQRTFALPASDSTLAKSTAATLATVLTYALNNYLSLGPVVGSSAVAVAAAVVLGPTRPALQLAALCGSFAGMARTDVIPSAFASMLLGLVCSAYIRLFDRKKWLVGLGGRLGFIAQCACTSTFIALKYGMGIMPSPARKAMEGLVGTVVAPAALADFGLYKSMSLAKVLLTELPSAALYAVLGAFFIRAWKQYGARVSDRISTPTAAVGATGLVAALLPILPASAAGPAFVGSFVAMSAPHVLPDDAALALASIAAAVAQVGLTGVMLGGWGGKMGTSALLGVVGYRMLLSGRDASAEEGDAKSVKSA